MRLSKYFWLGEFTRSQTASRRGIHNEPTDQHLVNMANLAVKVLDPIREKFGSYTLSSGYRSLALNQAIGGSRTSQHMTGEAADIEIAGLSNYDLAVWIEQNCEYDQLILEFYTQGVPTSGWVHVSYKANGDNRQESLSFNGKQWSKGLVK